MWLIAWNVTVLVQLEIVYSGIGAGNFSLIIYDVIQKNNIIKIKTITNLSKK
jgi:hypothetical protein